jgi:hypothetical protein
LGFTRLDSPAKATLSNLYRILDADEYALAAWLLVCCPDLGEPLALDGKTLRGSASYYIPGVHLLAAVPSVAGAIAQTRVDAKTNEHKAALDLLGVLPLAGKVVTRDATFCQRDVCTKMLEGGGDYLWGDYLWSVKDNQPHLHFDIAALFAESAPFSPSSSNTGSLNSPATPAATRATADWNGGR